MTAPLLFSPLHLRDLTISNRIVVAPMCQYSAVDGQVQDWHLAHYSRLVLGGVGTIIVEATGVIPEGRISPGCLGLWDDGQIPGLQHITRISHAHGTAVGIQLAHAGRKASVARPWDGAGPLSVTGPEPAWTSVAPSAIPFKEGWPAPHELSIAEIVATIEAFRQAARRALKAGFDFVEIHGAHGYLINQFFSPLSNKRTDGYGGSRENRMRFALEVTEAVRAEWPQSMPLFYRASVIDDSEGGIELKDTVILARALKACGVDVIDCSSGGVSGVTPHLKPTSGPGFQVPLAAGVKKGADISTIAVGKIMEPKLAEKILQDKSADLVALGREFLADPIWSFRAAIELGIPEPQNILPHQYAFHLQRHPPAFAKTMVTP